MGLGTLVKSAAKKAVGINDNLPGNVNAQNVKMNVQQAHQVMGQDADTNGDGIVDSGENVAQLKEAAGEMNDGVISNAFEVLSGLFSG